MTTPARHIVVDGNEAVASIAHRASEVIAIYPITPSSPMGELADEWSSHGRTNIWDGIPSVVEMQSEAGAAGAVHGALQAGALATTFTSSQGLLLMIPNMYKIAGELLPAVFHVAARAVATHALSIFGDHSDVYACRSTGFAMLASGSVQEAHDLACVAHAATLRARIPFLHFFDGFRTSHEVHKIVEVADSVLRALFVDDLVRAHRDRALSPDHPTVRGTAQNPDTFFQAREAANPFCDACAGTVAETMEAFAALTGRRYRLFDYVGHPEAERVIVMMGSGAEAAHELCDWLVTRGERVGVLKVRLYRPFAADHFLAALPETVRAIAVLDRAKEPGAPGEPLYQDVVTAFAEDRGAAARPAIIGGRYGLSSKELDAGMLRAVFDALSDPAPRTHFTIGIVDDVTHSSLPWDRALDIEADDVFRGVFYGLGSDGTVGANKSSIKIIGEATDHDAQGYFVYDSKKSGATTESHLRFGPRPLRSSYLVKKAAFVACHEWSFLERLDVLARAAPGAVFLVNSPIPAARVWDHLPWEAQEAIVAKGLSFFVIDADRVAREAGLGGRINAVMQTCFFAISGVLPRDEAIDRIKQSIKKTYGKKGDEIVALNFQAVDRALAALERVTVPAAPTTSRRLPNLVPDDAPPFVKRVTAVMMSGKGDLLPVSAFPPDGTWPSGTSKWEKRTLASEIPVWDEALCIQCNKCVLVCPHAAIRAKVYGDAAAQGAPATWKSVPWKARNFAGDRYTLQVAPEDCTGCTLCVHVCPAADKATGVRALEMAPQPPLREAERDNYAFFLAIPDPDRARLGGSVKDSQLMAPLFEYSGACVGCGETPYIKLVTQLFGDRALVANATGCSSIFGGNLPTTPYTVDCHGRGPAWANSLFEDDAEFGLGFRLAVDTAADRARLLVAELAPRIGDDLATTLLQGASSREESEIARQRERVEILRSRLASLSDPRARSLLSVADYLVGKSIWIVGGDGWAYDIGYGGLDHVLALGRDVNVLVLDTGVYSNTGGQASKATPLGASARFAARGKETPRKDLGLMAMAYGHVYVAQVALGANDAQTLRAIAEAESYHGASLLIAYSACIAHGFEMGASLDHQKLAVASGFWPLYRYDPRRSARGETPLQIDSKPPTIPFDEYARSETRFRALAQSDPERARVLIARAQADVTARMALYQKLAAR